MKSMKTFVLVVVACLGAGDLQAQSSAEQQVRAVMEQLKQASLAGDSEKAASLMADDYIQTDISGHVQDKATWFREYFNPLAELIKSGKFHWEQYERKDLQFRLNGDSALVMGSLEVKGAGAKWAPQQHTWVADPKGSFSGTLKFTHVYVRHNGGWLIAAVHNAVPVVPQGPSNSGGDENTAKSHAPSAEMEKLFNAFQGTWSFRSELASGQSGTGKQVWRAGPGGLTLIEEFYGETTGSLGFSVTWWDASAKGYRAIWCENRLPTGCTVMSKLAQWQGSDFVLGDLFVRDGKKMDYREVISDVTPTTYTQTIYQGEAGSELKRVITIHAVKQ